MKQLQFTYHITDAITPLDGRNRHKLQALTPFLSELALNKYRIYVEIEYLKALSKHKVIRPFTQKEIADLNKLSDSFDEEDYKKLREIESTTNHDLQAVVVYIQRHLERSSLKDQMEMVHFGLTSDDINNLAYALMTHGALKDVLLPEVIRVEKKLREISQAYKNIPMLGRTHGQFAAPTIFGKEMEVFKSRLSNEIKILKNHKLHGKLNGNVGNLNAHTLIFPKTNWINFTKSFVSSLGLITDLLTTQIEPYDSYIYLFQTLFRINNILNGLCKDMWTYAMLGYVTQKVVKKEVGSTALPHKVNPIYFEGAEGGFGLANALFSFYSEKLSYSRLQRDLSDSTVRRSFGMAFAYSYLSYQSIVEGLDRIAPNKIKMEADLSEHFEVLSEAVQNMLRAQGVKAAYQKAKDFFRGAKVTQASYQKFVESLPIQKEESEKLINLTPQTYIGVAEKLATYEK